MAAFSKLTEGTVFDDDLFRLEDGMPPTGGEPDLENDVGLLNEQARLLGGRTKVLRTLADRSCRAVISRLNAPPANPAEADAYLTGSAPTGAWAGRAERLAIWQNGAWRFAVPQNGQLISVGTGTVYIIKAGIASQWLGDFNGPGPVELATKLEVLAGTDNARVVTAQNLAFALGKTADGLPMNLKLSNSGQAAQSIPSDVITRCDNMVAVNGNAQGLWNGQRLTVDADSLGVWGVFCSLNTQGESGEGAYIYKNGANIGHYQFSSTGPSSAVCAVTVFAYLTAPGDFIEFYHRHKTGNAVFNGGSDAYMVRLLPYQTPA